MTFGQFQEISQGHAEPLGGLFLRAPQFRIERFIFQGFRFIVEFEGLFGRTGGPGLALFGND